MSDYNMTHTGRELDDAINKVKNGYIQPSGNSPTITSNGTHPVRQYENAVVNVQPSSDYIKKSDTKNYTTQFNCGAYTPSSDVLISATSITVGFKPKMFVIRSFTGFNTTSTKSYANNSWMITDNSYAYTLCYPNGSDQARTGGTTGFSYSSSRAQSVQSNGAANVFYPTANGVAGNGGSGSFYLCGGKTYFWFAWG